MNATQARLLLPQTVVMLENDPNDLGTVTSVNDGWVWIQWHNYPGCAYDFGVMQDISLYDPDPKRGEK